METGIVLKRLVNKKKPCSKQLSNRTWFICGNYVEYFILRKSFDIGDFQGLSRVFDHFFDGQWIINGYIRKYRGKIYSLCLT